MRPSCCLPGAALFLLLSAICTVRTQGGIPLRPPEQLESTPAPDANDQGTPNIATPAPMQAATPTPAGTPLDELQITKNELKETKDRLKAFEAENEVLRRRNESTKQSLRTLNESLAVANAESELFRRQYGDLKLRMEALGLESVGDNKQALEERLLKAVRDLGLVRDEKDRLSERLVALTEAMLLYMKAAPVADPQIRMEVEAQMRAANQSLDESVKNAANAATPALDLNSGSVVSVKDDLSLLVANIGAKNGVKVGMPFSVTRAGKLIAKARVIEVRDRISGAIIEEYTSTADAVKIGDHLQVDAQQ